MFMLPISNLTYVQYKCVMLEWIFIGLEIDTTIELSVN